MKDTKDYIYYPDNGCEKAKKLGYTGLCLDCPFEVCLENEKALKPMQLIRKQRNKEILQDFCAGIDREELAKKYKITVRTVRYILSNK